MAVAFAALAVARVVLREVVGRYDSHRLGVDEGQVLHWLDLYASRDPVAEGSLPVSRFGSSSEIVNRRSPLLDHTTYWQNVEGVRAAVALELARLAGWRDTTQLPERVAAAAAHRTARVRVLVGAHQAIAVVATGVAAFFARDLGELVAGAAGAIDGSAEDFLLVGWRSQPIACLLLAVIAGALALLASNVWDRWSNGRTHELLAREMHEQLAPRSTTRLPPAARR